MFSLNVPEFLEVLWIQFKSQEFTDFFDMFRFKKNIYVEIYQTFVYLVWKLQVMFFTVSIFRFRNIF